MEEEHVKSEQENAILREKLQESEYEVMQTKCELAKLKELIQAQSKTLATSQQNIKEDKIIIERMEGERKQLAKHVEELEKDVSKLVKKLNKEKQNAVELKEMICALNKNRKALEEEISWLKNSSRKGFLPVKSVLKENESQILISDN